MSMGEVKQGEKCIVGSLLPFRSLSQLKDSCIFLLVVQKPFANLLVGFDLFYPIFTLLLKKLGTPEPRIMLPISFKSGNYC